METFTKPEAHSIKERLGRRLLPLLLLLGIAQSVQAISYNSTTVTQLSTAVVNIGSTNQQVIQVMVNMKGGGASMNLTSLTIGTTGTTSLSDIKNLKIFHTGTTNVFDTTTQFGSTVASPASSNTITGTIFRKWPFFPSKIQQKGSTKCAYYC